MGYFEDLRKYLRGEGPKPVIKHKVDLDKCTFDHPNMQAKYHEPKIIGSDVDITGEKLVRYKCFWCGLEWSAHED